MWNRSLKEVIGWIKPHSIRGNPKVSVKGITCDSRRVEENYIFVAIRGAKYDGVSFIHEAIHRGASALILSKIPDGVEIGDRTVVLVDDPLSALTEIARIFYGEPSKNLFTVGVTGTNGKSTTAAIIQSIFREMGEKAGLIGTIEYVIGDRTIPSPFTTPPPCLLQKVLREMVDEGVESCAMEISSHGLSQGRVKGLHLDTGVWTNLSRDHLDFHHSMEDYYRAKERLFTEILSNSQKKKKYAIINLDDPYGKRLHSAIPGDLITLTYGSDPSCDLLLERYDLNISGSRLRLRLPRDSGSIEFSSSLIGLPNIYNTMAALATGLCRGIPTDIIIRGIERFKGIKGRFERVDNPLGIDIFIDYAHTPDALSNLLKTLKGVARGRLITIFGCGGDRDRGKRPDMGRVASTLSDIVVITSDNPRSEDPISIIEDIRRGISDEMRFMKSEDASLLSGRGYFVIPERGEAIRFSLSFAEEGDMVVIAGKGHESVIIKGSRIIPFDDREEVEKVIREIGKSRIKREGNDRGFLP